MAFFIELGKIVLKFIWKNKRPRIVKVIQSQKKTKKEKSVGITMPDFK